MAGSPRVAPKRRTPLRLLTTMALIAALSGTVLGTATPALAWTTSAITVAGSCAGSGASQLNRPQGIARDASGNLFIADMWNSRIQKWAAGASAGTTALGGTAGSALNQFRLPSGVAFDGAGNLYVSDITNHRVLRFGPNQTTGVVVAGGQGAGSQLYQLANPEGIAVDSVGNLYIADTSNHRVVWWQPGAVAGIEVAGFTGTPGNFPYLLSYPRAVALDSSGTTLYVADSGNNRIQRFSLPIPDENGVTVAGGVTAGSGPASLNNPRGLALDAAGNLYIADTGNNRVQRWALGLGATSGVTVAGGNGAGSAPNQLWSPIGVAVDASSNVFVSDQMNNRVQRWAVGSGATSGVTVAGSCPGSSGSADNQLATPRDVAIDSAGNVYVADSNNHRVQKWTPGNPLATTVAGTGVAGSTATQLNSPSSVVVDALGNLYVADTGNNRVQKFSAGSPMGTTVATGLSGPQGLALDQATGNLYVTDPLFNRVLRFSPSSTTGTVVAGGNLQGSAPNQLNFPRGVAFVAGTPATLYIADSNNHRVQKWIIGQTSGTTVAGTGVLGSTSTQLNVPVDVVLDPSGYLYVSDSGNHRVQKFPPNPNSISPWTGTTIMGTGFPGSGPTQLIAPMGLTRDAYGNAYVADSGNHRVQKWIGSPNAPTGVTVSLLNGSTAVVSFTPGDPGGKQPYYTATCVSSNGGLTGVVTNVIQTTPIQVTGLSVPYTYTCTVRATNDAGSSTSSPSAPFTTFAVTAPGTPTGVTVSLVTGSSVAVSFTPGPTGGATPTYLATCVSSNGGVTRTGSSSTSPIQVTGLSVSYTYTCTVTATNSAGSSTSSPSAPFTTVTTPGAPTGVTVSLQNGSTAVVSFTPGSTGGGTPSYTATCVSSNGGVTRTGTNSTSPIQVTSLSVPYTYTCTVTATNIAGSATSSPSAPFTTVLITAPGTPTGITVSLQNGSTAVVSFTPGSTGGGTTTYTATCVSSNGGITRTGTNSTSPIQVTSLSVPYTYTCTVTATNSAGSSTSSPSAPFTTFAVTVPGTPTGVTVSLLNGATAVVSFTPGSTGGATPTYTATCVSSNGGVTRTGTNATTPIQVTNLSVPYTYTCTVRATNSAGSSPESSPSAPFTTKLVTAPYAPQAPTAKREDFGVLRLTTTVPGSSGSSPIAYYTITSTSGNLSCTINGPNPDPTVGCTIGGLQPYVDYQFVATATNQDGATSSPSSASTAMRVVTRTFIGSVTSETSGSSSTQLNLPTLAAPIPVGARLILYIVADTQSSLSPGVAVSYPLGGAASGCLSFSLTSVGGTSTPGTGVGALAKGCAVTTAIPAGSAGSTSIRLTLTWCSGCTPGRVAVMAEYILGASSTTVLSAWSNVKGGVTGGAPTSYATTVYAGDVGVGVIAFENGAFNLAPDDDTIGGVPWSSQAYVCVGPADDTGLCIVRQYKFPRIGSSLTYNSTTSLVSTVAWQAVVLSLYR